jgi:hypothetical protein
MFLILSSQTGNRSIALLKDTVSMQTPGILSSFIGLCKYMHTHNVLKIAVESVKFSRPGCGND